MSNIFFGFLLIFFDFNFTINEIFIIGLIPDFAGYILMVKGLDTLAHESFHFERIRPFTVGMGIYSGIIYAFDLFGLSSQISFFGSVLGIVSAVISIYITYVIILGIREIEDNNTVDLKSKSLMTCLAIMAILQAVVLFFSFIPISYGISIAFIIFSLLVNIVFLVCFNTSKNLYEQMPYDND